MKLTLKLNTTYKYIQFWNSLFNLTPKELTILAYFIEVNETSNDINLCSNKNKKLVAKKLKFTDHTTLNNYVKKLKDKGAITLKNEVYGLHRILREKQKITVDVIRTN